MARLANMAHSAYSMNKAYSAHLNEAYFAYLEKKCLFGTDSNKQNMAY